MSSSATARSTLPLARIVLAAALLLFALWVAAGLVRALVWAVVVAVAIDPLYVRARARWSKGRGTGVALAMTAAFALLVLVPLAIGISQAAREAHDISIWIGEAQANGLPPPAWLSRLPLASGDVIEWWQTNLATPEAAQRQLHHLGHATLVANYRLIGGNILNRFVIFAFTLITLFFLLRDRDVVIAQCRAASHRLFGAAGEDMGRQAILSIRGTIDGLVLVGIGEGIVMTLVYLFLDVPHPIALGAATAIAAMIPFGAAAMFVIAAILLLIQNAFAAAVAVVGIGLLVVGIADHFVRPAMIGGATRLPFLWVLVGILGGVERLGLLGLFVGPATMAVLVMLWRELVQKEGEGVRPA